MAMMAGVAYCQSSTPIFFSPNSVGTYCCLFFIPENFCGCKDTIKRAEYKIKVIFIFIPERKYLRDDSLKGTIKRAEHEVSESIFEA